MLRRGRPPKTLADLLGHSNVSVLMAHYQCVTDANKIAAASAMDRLLAKAVVLAKGA